ncbi:MAG: tRNA (N(6)-L-threonylcarbamoyladenosine(37)-C(2))-methylthiotransferase MtaB [Chloroflexota bacterium]|nr:tRNA (N(6)-L-threonylcarbamoyladenosine(37)-C(2))-methylthiotransferase MtaB [Chloroflexota bacterium]
MEGRSGPGTIALQTVGCKLNQAETDSLVYRFREAGYQIVAPNRAADIYLLNTCTVTHIADHKCRKLLRLAHRRNPHSIIVVTGCYAERAPGELSSIEGVGVIIPNSDKDNAVEIVKSIDGFRTNGQKNSPHRIPSHTRTLIKIQEGCQQHCSFCIVPRVRGPERSYCQDDIIAEIKTRVTAGYKEVVLTGTRIGRYRQPGGLEGLIRRILEESDIQRLRLSSLEPYDLTPALVQLWDNKRLCPHIHLPLQSGSDSVLTRMRRPYSIAEYRRAASLAQEAIPNLALTTDIMVGFPGESDSEFEESYGFCEDIGFARIHVFPYSSRPGTCANEFADKVEDREKKRRTQLMLSLANTASRQFQERFLGQNVNVLWEENKNGIWYGTTDNYLHVNLSSRESLSNELRTATLVALGDSGMWGKLTDTSELQPTPLCNSFSI